MVDEVYGLRKMTADRRANVAADAMVNDNAKRSGGRKRDVLCRQRTSCGECGDTATEDGGESFVHALPEEWLKLIRPGCGLRNA